MNDATARDKLADQAARAAREAAAEAPTTEARRFLREHANFLARTAAARRRGVGRDRGPLVVTLLPLLQSLPA
jgi:hypothetical protein